MEQVQFFLFSFFCLHKVYISADWHSEVKPSISVPQEWSIKAAGEVNNSPDRLQSY